MTPLNQVVPKGPPAVDGKPGATHAMVVSVIAEVTRYPRDILVPEAHLEEELGIDSVKRAEILAVLGSRFNIPETAGPPPNELRTIGDLAAAIDAYLAASGATAATPQAPPPAAPAIPPRPAPSGTPTTSDESLLGKVVEVIVQVTRYPRQILVAGADLEEELGFDLSRRSAILAALRQQLAPGLPPDASVTAARTIGDLVSLVERFAVAPAAATRAAAPIVPAPPVLTQVHPPLVAAKPFAGRIALVTGSGHGLGKVFATRLASLGATVVVNSFHSRQLGDECAHEIVAAGGEAIHLWGSVANPSQFAAIFTEIGNRYGGLDFFVSNAAHGVLAPLADVKPEDWDKAFRTCVVAFHQGSLQAADLMRRRGGGKIVAISSTASQRYVDYYGCMGPVKAALESLVRYLAVELGSDNIQVNAVTAGPVYGELLDNWPDGKRLRAEWEQIAPRRRLNEPDELADAVTFLLTNTGVNGAVLLVDAGSSQRIRASWP